MRVRRLKLTSFRNYRELEFIPEEGLNILHGANAQGKSNILEALYLLATTRSLRAGRESELILRGSEMAHVNADVEREREGEVGLQVSVFSTDKKAVRINGLKRDKVLALLGEFNAVFFGASDLAIVNGEPSDRRHYLNVEISQISPRYVYDLGHFKRVLEQRNRLLRDLRDRPRPARETGLDAWNAQLVNYGSTIIEKRKFYIERLSPLADRIHRELTDGKESLEVRYLPNIPLPIAGAESPRAVRESSREDHYVAAAAEETESGGDSRIDSPAGSTRPTAPESALSATESISDAFRRQLAVVAADEARRGLTLIGPQRDDLGFYIDGLEARVYGSQGQQRTVALALKLAEFRLIEDYVGEAPVMLLDDVMSDLDDARRGHLLQWMRRRCQTFLTCTNLRSFPKEVLAEAATFRVVAGTVKSDGNRKIRTARRAAEAAEIVETEEGAATGTRADDLEEREESVEQPVSAD